MSLDGSELPIMTRLIKRLDLMEERLLEGFQTLVVEPTDAALTRLELSATKHDERMTSIEGRLTVLENASPSSPAA